MERLEELILTDMDWQAQESVLLTLLYWIQSYQSIPITTNINNKLKAANYFYVFCAISEAKGMDIKMNVKVNDIEFQSADHVIEEIRNMNVKGGSPFGRSAAWAIKLACEQENLPDNKTVNARIDDLKKQMTALKPTMATIYNSCHLVEEFCQSHKECSTDELKKRIIKLCENIIRNSFDAVDKLGEYGANMIKDGSVIMMHSYSSTLMSIFIAAAAQGKKFTVICTESRPLRESRLAVKYLQELGENVIYITDAELYEFMPMADFILMGVDSLACDGSVANKIGSAMVAKLAKTCKKPVYFASELYKYDTRTKYGYNIVLERRTRDEIVCDGDFASYDGLEVINQFFDLTPASDVTALICEYGFIHSSNIDVYWQQLADEVSAV